jgi:uncharacterized protein
MTVDDLSTPLGQRPASPRRELPISVPKVVAAALALFLGAFVAWAIISDDPFGGEPRVAVPIDQRGLAAANKPEAAAPQSTLPAPATAGRTPANTTDAAPDVQQRRPVPPPGTKTVTIIDGKTGARQEILIPSSENEGPAASANSKGAK